LTETTAHRVVINTAPLYTDLKHDNEDLLYTVKNWTDAFKEHLKNFVNMDHIFKHFPKNFHKAYNAPPDFDKNFS
jgi:hypothetical protein